MNRRAFITCSALVVAVISSITTETASARGRVRFRRSGLRSGQQHAGPVLSQEELRACVQRESSLNQRSDALDSKESALSRQKVEIEQLEELIERKRVAVDVYHESSVNRYNALIDKHRRMVRNFNAQIPTFNGEVKAYQADQSAFNSQCAGKAYRESDMQSVRSASK